MRTYVGALILATFALPSAAHAQPAARIQPPDVPQDIALSPDDYKPYLAAHAIGTQGYVCVAVGTTFSWTPFGPQATLFNEDGQQVLTHFLSPAPYDLLPTATWQHSRDSSVVWARMLKSSTDSNYVAPDAIPLAAARSGRRRRRADWRRQTARDAQDSAGEYGGGQSARDRLLEAGGHRQERARPL